MPVRLRCPECSTNVTAPDELRGKTVRCPKCRTLFRAEQKNSASAIQQSPSRSPSPVRGEKEGPAEVRAPSVASRGTVPPPAPRRSHAGLIVGVAAAAGALFLLLAAGVGVAAWLLWPRPSAGPAPVPVAAVEAPAPGAPAAEKAAPPAVPPADAAPFHLADVRKSVVFIRRSTPGGPTAAGTGFFVTGDGVIATNRHVIQAASGPNPATVLFVGVPSAADPDVLDYFRATVAFCPPVQDTLDFALLKIAAKPGYQPFRPLPLAPAGTKMELGDPVAAVGFPFAAADKPVLSFNKGSISATRRDIEDHPYYQTDAAVNPGNSGGPLINADGQVVGVVSRKRDDANNMGFALYLSETGLPGVLNQDKVALLRPEAGPLDSQQVPMAGAAKPTRLSSWQITHGTAVEEKGLVIADNNGGPYWLTNKDPLPENFQLNIECFVAPLRPEQQLPFGPPRGFGPAVPRPPIFLPQPPANANILRSLYVRFGTDAVDRDIASMSATTVHLSAAQLQVAENGVAVATQRKGVPDDLFLLTVTRRGDELTVAVNGDVWAKQKLQYALQGSHKFSIGGLQSGLILRGASFASVDGPPVPAPLAGDPPKPAPSAPPNAVAFDAGWDKPLDPDGDCKIAPDKAALTIEVPAGQRHDIVLDQGVMNAPRLLRDATGDFTAQVRVAGDFEPTAPSTSPVGLPFLGAGLVLISADQTVLRLERAAVNRGAQTVAYVNWEGRTVGRPNWSANGGLRADEPPLYLRLRRQGDRFFGAFSRDGVSWTELAPQDVKLPPAVKLGVAAVTTSAGAFKATYDDFRLGASGDVPPPPAPPPADPKIWAARPPADWKGPEWTADPDKMKAPDGAPSGWLMGADFKADEVTFSPIGWLTFRQGPPGPAAVGEVVVILREHTLADLEGKTLTVTGKQDQFPPIFGNARRVTAERQQKVEPLVDFFMKLEFGKLKDGKLSGSVYLCLPDDAKSVIAGTFQFESK